MQWIKKKKKILTWYHEDNVEEVSRKTGQGRMKTRIWQEYCGGISTKTLVVHGCCIAAHNESKEEGDREF